MYMEVYFAVCIICDISCPVTAQQWCHRYDTAAAQTAYVAAVRTHHNRIKTAIYSFLRSMFDGTKLLYRLR